MMTVLAPRVAESEGRASQAVAERAAHEEKEREPRRIIMARKGCA
jgi:hypothetical protein